MLDKFRHINLHLLTIYTASSSLVPINGYMKMM